MIWNIHAAKTNLSKLIEKAEAGEEVVITHDRSISQYGVPILAV